MNRITLQEIADRAQVSRNTVSCALRNDRSISLKTRQKIQELAHHMGYRPDPRLSELMTHLRTRRRHASESVLAWVHDWPRSIVSSHSFQDPSSFIGAKKQAEALGFTLEEFLFDREQMTGRRFSHMLSSRGIRGIVFGAMHQPQTVLNLLWNSFCMVAIGFTLKSPILSRVSNYQLYSLQLALNKAFELGYRRPLVWLPKDMNKRTNDAWYAACALHQKKSGVPVPLLEAEQNSAERISAYLREHKIDVLLTFIPPPSTTLKELMQIERASIPNQLGIINIHQFPADRKLQISGIDQQWDKVGAAAVDMLVNDINLNRPGIPDTPRTLLIEGRWVDGITTRKQKGERARH